jgi:hypothetical protein
MERCTEYESAEVAMRHTCYAILVLLAAALAGTWAGNQEVLAPEGRKLQGTWEVTSVEKNGQPDPTQVGSRLTFSGRRVIFQANPLHPLTTASSTTVDDKAIAELAFS